MKDRGSSQHHGRGTVLGYRIQGLTSCPDCVSRLNFGFFCVLFQVAPMKVLFRAVKHETPREIMMNQDE